MDAALLDTDILSEVLKRRNFTVVRHASDYLQAHRQFSFSIFTRFEIARGYHEKRASRLIANFNAFCRTSSVLSLSGAIFERAAELWVVARRGGHPHADADILIAATALEKSLVLATGNTPHFAWVPGLTLVDWRKA